VDPTTGYVFVNAHDTSLVGWIEQKRPGLNYGRGTEGSTIPYDRGSVNGAGPYFTFSAPLKDDTGRTIANLVICRLGEGGALRLASPVAACDLIADVMGYFAD